MNGDYVTIDDRELGDDENLNGQPNGSGDSTSSQSDRAYNWSGTAVDYNQVIGEYTNRAYSELNDSKYENMDSTMKDYIKDYFTELN